MNVHREDIVQENDPATPTAMRNQRAGKTGGHFGLNNLLRLTGVDRAIGFSLMANVWSAAAAPVTLWLIAAHLSSTEQGYFYTFGSILALKTFFELGLTNVLVNFVSHEHAQLANPDETVRQRARVRMGNLLAVSVKYYTVGASLFLVTVVIAGRLFFAVPKGGAGDNVFWQLPWLVVCTSTAGSLMIAPITAFLMGCGRVSEVLRIRFFETAFGNILSWIILLSGGGLFNACANTMSTLLVVAVWLAIKYRAFVMEYWRAGRIRREIDWWREVFPMQWRIATSWILGYFIFQLFNPILFKTSGPVVAGQMGMSLNLLNAISGLAIAWVSTKAPLFGSLIARRQWATLDETFNAAILRSILIKIAALLVVILGLTLGPQIGFKLKFFDRLLDLPAFVVLALAILVNHATSCMAIYLRSNRSEPMLWPTIVGAFLMVPTVYYFGLRYQAMGVCAAYLGNALIGLIWASLIFANTRRAWRMTG
jgi:hypothetical protein